MTTPQDVFGELLTRAPAASGEAFRAFSAPPGLSLRAFVDGITRLPGVALRVRRDVVPLGIAFPRMRGAETGISADPGSPPTVVYRIRPADRSFAPVFVELAGQLVDEASRAESAQQALVGVSRRLAAWARFFDTRGDRALGRNAQLGLIGELLCLETLAAGAGFGRAVRAWRGPDGATQDFQTTAGSIEVKTSTSASPEHFRVSSERQLDESVVPRLVLCGLTAQELPAGGTTLASVVDRIRGRLVADAPSEVPLFEDRLVAAGYTDHDRTSYDLTIAVLHLEFAHVTSGFPRIQPSDLRPGVSGVSYDLSRASIRPFLVSTTFSEEIIRAID
jgi:hypothetical protein